MWRGVHRALLQLLLLVLNVLFVAFFEEMVSGGWQIAASAFDGRHLFQSLFVLLIPSPPELVVMFKIAHLRPDVVATVVSLTVGDSTH